MGLADDIALAKGDSPRVADLEIAELRRGILPWLVPFTAGAAWLWLSYVVWVRYPIGLNQAPVVVLPLAAWLAHQLRDRCYTVACWALCLGVILSLSTIIAAHPFSKVMAFGILVVMMANALLGPRHALVGGILMWLAANVAQGGGSISAIWGFSNLDMAVLYLATWGLGWLAVRPLNTAVAQSLAGWQHANEALAEVRQRKADLYRALRAMEEANYRIDHMNHELVLARREAEAARALKARFVATVSHELRGPLNLILGFSRFMALSPELYGGPLPVSYRSDVDAIYRNATHLAALVDDILDLSQIEAQRLPLVKDRINLETDVIDKAVNVVRPLIQRKALGLHVQCAPRLPWILADEVRLRQILLNLLANAVRFTDRGQITVTATANQQEILLSVRDTGSGIPAQDLPKLFREFGQLSPKERGEQRGSGLGLNIAKQLVELHGGRIWAESDHGVGTTIWFTLPLPGVSPNPSELIRTEDDGVRQAASETCVIIYDDPTVVRILGRYLEGYRIVGLPRVSDVSAIVQQLQPRALVTTPDLLPVVRRAVQGQSLDVPIISCTLPRTMAQRQMEGVLSYLIKPITPESVTAVMASVERADETIVLLADDEPDAVRLLESTLMLIPRPYRILKAYSGEEALALMQETVPDIVFVDLVMPGLDGEATIARMRADQRLSGVPVVIVSARDVSEGGLAVELPISIHRNKPVEMGKATRLLSALIDNVSRDS